MKAFHSKDKGIGIIFDDIFFINGARTPFGKYCGTLANVSPTDLGIFASKAAISNSNISPSDIDQAVMANIGQSSGDAYFFPRHVALFSGLPMPIPALMVQRICASGFETIVTSAEQITLGKADATLCCGAESMSLAPTVSFGNRMGYPLGRPVFKDMLWEALDDTAAGYPMGFTAENVAVKHKITRNQCDEYALLSFNRAIAAKNNGFLNEEITPINSTVFEIEGLKSRKVKLSGGVKDFTSDEQIRETNLESLSKLPNVFAEVGVLTAGNCSGIVDGAAAGIVASGSFVKSKNINPIAKVVAAATSGIDPKVMGLGPVPAIKYLLEITGLKIDEIGLFEINEAFSSQVIGCEIELGLDRNKLNVNGGAIAIGHPLAASGLRLSLTLAKEMKRKNIRYGIASACIGGGQGTAVLFENINL
ncbi:MAG: thiolase family protein [Bacteroidetes bacterium]|nr:thiolase family protein [Bacteroidota bacterium]